MAHGGGGGRQWRVKPAMARDGGKMARDGRHTEEVEEGCRRAEALQAAGARAVAWAALD